jgi:hypothetical protein
MSADAPLPPFERARRLYLADASKQMGDVSRVLSISALSSFSAHWDFVNKAAILSATTEDEVHGLLCDWESRALDYVQKSYILTDRCSKCDVRAKNNDDLVRHVWEEHPYLIPAIKSANKL